MKLAEQFIGWKLDLNDGVRLRIRPFMSAKVVRHNETPKPHITCDKGIESGPWFKVFEGDRMNDHHLTIAEKRYASGAARCC